MKRHSIFSSFQRAIILLAFSLSVTCVLFLFKPHISQAGTVTFKLSNSTLKIKKGKRKTLKIKKLKGAKKVKWSITDKSIVTVKKSKKSITIKGKKDGITAIIAKAGNCKLVCKVVVGKGTRITEKTRKALAKPITPSNTTKTNEVSKNEVKKQPVLLESGYTKYRYDFSASDNSTYINYAAKIKNPNSSYNICFAGVDIIVYNTAGSIIHTNDSLLWHIPAGDSMYVTGLTSVADTAGTIGKIVIQARPIADYNFEPQDNTKHIKTSNYAISNTAEVNAEEYYLHYTGSVIRNSQYQDKNSAKIAVVFRKNGNLVGGAYDWLNALGEGVFEVAVHKSFINAIGPYTYDFGITYS